MSERVPPRCRMRSFFFRSTLSLQEGEGQSRAAKRAAFSQAIARLQQGSVAAATALLKTILDPATPASVRVRASECVLNHGLRALEVEDIEARVSALEASAGEQREHR